MRLAPALAFVTLALAGCGGSSSLGTGADASAHDAGLEDAPSETAAGGTLGGQTFVARGAWANVENDPSTAGGPWLRVVLLDSPGSCDDAAVIPRAGATEVHLFVLHVLDGGASPVVPARYATNAPNAGGLLALIFGHRYDAQCKESFAAEATGSIEIDAISDTVAGSFDGTLSGSGEQVRGTFVAPACPLPDGGASPSCL